MVQNNKVLTVSYGTFSCTLEGFEDSFGTMKVIAEYFRDLAADDRYFGAEPPQPDADMLARIAQREIARQVEAHTSDQGVHLRAASLTPPADAAPVAAPVAEPELVETPTAETAAAPVAAPAPELETLTETPEITEPPVDDSDAEQMQADVVEPSVNAELADEIAEVTEEIAETPDEAIVEEVLVDEAPVIAPPEHAPLLDSALPADSETAAAFFADSDTSFADEDDDALFATNEVDDAVAKLVSQSKDTPEKEEPAAVDAKPRSTSESIAAKLQRIRAVVSRTPTQDFSEDQHADAQPDDVTEEDPIDTIADEDDATISSALQQLDTPAAAAPETPADEEENLFDTEDTAPAAPPAPPRRRRLIRVKRAAVDEAVAQGDLEPTAATPSPDPAPVVEEPQEPAMPEISHPASSLSAEDEADLRSELAAVEAELLAAAQTDTPPAAKPTPRRPIADTQTAESDVSRLMDAADEKLDDPETSSSRETYGHMRAAVAAAHEDRAAGQTASDDAEEYRKDLASVVQPRRPVAKRKTNRTAGEQNRPAPLKLVAEQRIDETEKPQATTPVRPRRVRSTMVPPEASSDEGGFASYARETGAVELQEMLEAAASYLSFVEGKPVFSRPDLMNKLRAAGSDFNREDGLRSFGQLLREGKIARAENGRFSAAEHIGFQPGTSAAG